LASIDDSSDDESFNSSYDARGGGEEVIGRIEVDGKEAVARDVEKNGAKNEEGESSRSMVCDC
jgi:hypothetical protein